MKNFQLIILFFLLTHIGFSQEDTTIIYEDTTVYNGINYTDKKYEVVAIIKADNIRKAQSTYKREYDKSATFNRWSNHYAIER